jgi:16S rRNA processing protein RimM
MAAGARVCVGQIGAPHGVRGEVRLRSFTADPEAIAGYGPLETEDGRILEIESLRPAKDHFVATLSGIGDRDAAEQLATLKLYVPRDRLPALVETDEFYHADLIGLAVFNKAGEQLGTVLAIHNFGAGDLIEVRLAAGGKTELVPFNERNVPTVDIAAGRIVIEPSALAGQGE